MSTGFLKKPSRPPPPPPIENHQRSFSNSFNSRPFGLTSSNHKSATLAAPNHRKISSSKSRSDYIKISECHTGHPLGDRPLGKPAGYKSRASTSFSSTLKPTSSNDYYLQSSHQKSRSLTENHRSSTYLYLDLPSTSPLNSAGSRNGTLAKNSNPNSNSNNNNNNNNLFFADDRHSPKSIHSSNIHEPHHVSTVYKTVDFMKTDALNKCKVERTSGRGTDLKGR